MDAILPTPEPGVERRRRRRLALGGLAAALVTALGLAYVATRDGDSRRSDGDSRPVVAPTSTSTTTTTPTTLATATTSDAGAAPLAGPYPTALTPADLAAAEGVVRQMIAAAQRRDCDALFALLSARTVAAMAAMADIGDRPTDVKASLCQEIESEPVPDMSITKPARAGPNGTAIVELTSRNDVEAVVLVREGGTWKLDLLGQSLEESEDRTPEVQRALRNGLSLQQSVYADRGRYSDDIAMLESMDSGIDWRPGIADRRSSSGIVYVALADQGQTVCLSAISSVDRLSYMLKHTRTGQSYAKGAAVPATCDSRTLSPGW